MITFDKESNMKKYAKSHFPLLPIYKHQSEYELFKPPEKGDIFIKQSHNTSEHNNFCYVMKVTKKNILFRLLKPELIAICKRDDNLGMKYMYKLDDEKLVSGKNNRIPYTNIKSLWLPRHFIVITK